MYYGLDGRPIPMEQANALFAGDARRVAHTTLVTDRGRVTVSTVFLVIDHSFGDGGPPVLWETLVFDGPSDQEMRRYTSLADALAGHAEVVTETRQALTDDGAVVLAEETFNPEGTTR